MSVVNPFQDMPRSQTGSFASHRSMEMWEQQDGAPAPPGQGKSSSRVRSIAKVFGVIGTLAVVGVAGFLAGSASGGSDDGAGASSGTAAAESQARETVFDAFSDPENIAVTGELNASVVLDLLEEYEADPAAWVDPFVTSDIMEAFRTLRDAELGDGGVRALDAVLEDQDQALRAKYRELAAPNLGADAPLISEAWNRIETETYPAGSAVQDGDDFIMVRRDSSTGRCWIVAQESNSGTDWAQNLNLGTDDILSPVTSTITDESCGCRRRTWWWCSEYNTCTGYARVGRGYDGFVKAYNNMRVEAMSDINSRCASSDTKVFAGYSRGGGILNAFVFAALKSGAIPANRMQFINFGCPRTLVDSDSDFVHNRFKQYRLIYKKDAVPSIPYGWMGYKHFGTMRCYECGYEEGRDRPNFSLGFDGGFSDHTSYDEWF